MDTSQRQIEVELQEAKEAVDAINAELEARVEKRTYELSNERNRFKKIFDTAAEGIIVMSQDGSTCEVNDTAAKI